MLKKNQVALRSNDSPSRTSVLGPTLTFKGGELSSDEDLIIEGTIEGSIAHHNHKLTISKSGKVKADVRARVILVEGSIEGDMTGDEAVHIASTAHVVGNVSAPTVTLEQGASFDGRIKTTAASASDATAARVERQAVPSPTQADAKLSKEGAA